ncbi:aminoglycoside phosphotransferase family protein [Sphaerisporangium album]|uniref:Aminoglycoside phosphotransferase family protein n=1 Tax=Sphaerisporangium album TaxID=509200 RepID=A0A367EIL2_9ACTN|nr:phosphotransferase [Sphaerisporangium album]RCG17914.1 aminoglycoside phosphotransferase family protein [Sphaerisporangium album]
MTGPSTTHALDIGPDTVTKRYRSWEHQQPQREWRALELLAVHAPGLAPAPVRAELDVVPPTIMMSRLTGVPLGLTAVTTDQLEAMVIAITTVQETIPPHVVRELPPRPGAPAEMLQQVRAQYSRQPDLGGDPLVVKAFDAGADWLFAPEIESLLTSPSPAVFGSGDGNLGNFLWGTDGRVHLVDFEYAGRSDRCHELAEIAEHISLWATQALDPETLLARFDLAADESPRLRQLRRLMACFWFLRLLPGGSAHSRNPVGTLQHQAERFLILLQDG